MGLGETGCFKLCPSSLEKDPAGLPGNPRMHWSSVIPGATELVVPTSRQLSQLSTTQASPGTTHRGAPGRAEGCLGTGTLTDQADLILFALRKHSPPLWASVSLTDLICFSSVK